MILCPSPGCGGRLIHDEYETDFYELVCLLCSERWDRVTDTKFRKIRRHLPVDAEEEPNADAG